MAAWLEVLPGFEEGLPLDSLAEECDHPGRFGGLGRLGLAPAGQDGAHDPVGGHTARQGAHVAVFAKACLGPRAISTVCGSSLTEPAPCHPGGLEGADSETSGWVCDCVELLATSMRELEISTEHLGKVAV